MPKTRTCVLNRRRARHWGKFKTHFVGLSQAWIYSLSAIAIGSFCEGAGVSAVVDPFEARALSGDEKPKVESLNEPIFVSEPMESLFPWLDIVVDVALVL